MTGTERDGPPGRILLNEDDPVAAHFAMHVLGERGGFDVRHTPDPAVALQLAGSETWDLVLTDAELPGMTGLELLAALRQLAPARPVSSCTSRSGRSSCRPPPHRWRPRAARPGSPPGSPCSRSAHIPAMPRSARPGCCSSTAAWAMRSRSSRSAVRPAMT